MCILRLDKRTNGPFVRPTPPIIPVSYTHLDVYKRQYLGSGDYIRIPRIEWGVGMGHKTIAGGLMPGGRLRMEKLARLLETGRLDTGKLLTHKFNGFDSIEKALMLMKDKPADLIKPVVIL